MPKYENNPINVGSGSLDVVDDGVISSLQVATLAETTSRSTSKPKTLISGQASDGGAGGPNPHSLLAQARNTGPFLAQNDTNRTIFTDLYNNNPEKFNNRTINDVQVSDLPTFLHAVLGDKLDSTIDRICMYFPNLVDHETAASSTTIKNLVAKWTYSQKIPYKKSPTGRILTDDRWFIPEPLMLQITGVASLADITVEMMTDPDLLVPYLGTGNSVTCADFRWTSTRIKFIIGDAGGGSLFDLTDPNAWFTDVIEFLQTFAEALAPGGNGSVRVSPNQECIDANIDKTVGFGLSQKTISKFNNPIITSDDEISITGDILDPSSLPGAEQFQVDVPYSSDVFSRVSSELFADAADFNLLQDKSLAIEVWKPQVSQSTTTGGPPSIDTYGDFRQQEIDPTTGEPIPNRYITGGVGGSDESSVIDAINRVHQKTNLARDEAVQINQFLTNQILGNAALSNPTTNLSQSDANMLQSRGYDSGRGYIAADRLNLIPVLSGDRIFETVVETDVDGNVQYDDLGVPKIYSITLDQRAALTPENRAKLGMPHPNSDLPQTTLLEATYTIWRHISADTTNTYGVSAMTDPTLTPDQLIDPLADKSFINIFNSLYTDLSGLSGDVDLLQHALSGSGDLLIEPLSSFSIHTNINNLYTELSALTGQEFDMSCCTTLETSLTALSSQTMELSSQTMELSSYVMDLDLTTGGPGGSPLACSADVCEDIDSLMKTIITEVHPGGFDIPFPDLDDNGDPRPYVPSERIPTEDGPAGVEPGSVVYKTIIDKKEYIIYKTPGGWVADGPFDDGTPRHYDGPGVIISGGDDHGPGGGSLPEPYPQFPPIFPRPDPFPEWKDRLAKIKELEKQIDGLEDCCDEFQRFKHGVGELSDPVAPAEFEIPPTDPTSGDTPTGWLVPPNGPIIPTTNGGVVVPGPGDTGPTTYTPLPDDDPNRPFVAKPGVTVYTHTGGDGTTRYIYKDRTTNRWIITSEPGNPNGPDWNPLDPPPQYTPNSVSPNDSGGFDVDYPTNGIPKPYNPIPDGDPKPSSADPDEPVYKYIDNSTNTTHYIYKDRVTNRWIVSNGDPDDPTIPGKPLTPPPPHVVIKTIRDEFRECCDEFKKFLDKYNENPPPGDYEVPDFTPDSPDGPETPWYHPLPDDPTGPVIMPTDVPSGGISVPGPDSDDPKVYTPIPSDDPTRPPSAGVTPGTVIYKYITQQGETKYIYKNIITNKWVKGDDPDDPNDPTGTPLGPPPDDTGGVITRRPDGGVDVPYPPGGPQKPYEPIPSDDPGKPTNVCENSVVYKYHDQNTNTVQYVYCDPLTGRWMIGGNPDIPGAPKIPLDPPGAGPDTTTVINSLSAMVEKNIIHIDALSGCCVDNKTALSALSAAIYGTGPEPDVFVDQLTGSIVFNINTLYDMILSLDPGGTGNETGNIQITVNKTNIETLSASMVELSACCDTNNFKIEQTNTTLTNRITAIEHNIGNIGGDFVDLTDHQSISGEKVFEDDFTVTASAEFGENVTIGSGDSIFKCCVLPSGGTQVQITGLPEFGVNDITNLPINSIYVTEINGHKVLAIKTS